MDMHELDQLFAQARGTAHDAAQPSEALFSRIMADAERVQPKAVLHDNSVSVKRGWWSAFLALLGGGGALAGLTTAAAAGVLIGVAAPAPLTHLTESVFASEVDAIEHLELIALPQQGGLDDE